MINRSKVDHSDREYLSVKEFASYIDVHYNTVLRAIKSGKLNAFRIGAGKKCTFRIPKSEIHRIALFDMENMIEKIVQEKMEKQKKE